MYQCPYLLFVFHNSHFQSMFHISTCSTSFIVLFIFYLCFKFLSLFHIYCFNVFSHPSLFILFSFLTFCLYGVRLNLLYILNLLTLPGTTKQKIPNMVRKQAKSDQLLQSVAGYKRSSKSEIFGKVKEKGLT